MNEVYPTINKTIPIYDANYPVRQCAIRILETLAEMKGRPRMFDKEWYRFEDAVTEQIDKLLSLSHSRLY